MEDDDDEVFYGDLKKLNNLKPLNLNSPPTPKSNSKLWSMIVVKDPPSPTTKTSDDDEISVFPPCNHENLNPSNFNLEPKKTHSPPPPPQPSFPSPPLSFLSPDSDHSPSPAAAAITPFTEWWALTVQIFRSKIANFGSYFRCDDRKSFGNIALAATVVLWWFFARARRQRRRRMTSVEHLMQIITEKDEKIMQLLSQIAKMNEVLLTRHKAVASKLAN